MTLADIASAVAGRLQTYGQQEATIVHGQVRTDSREVEPGDVFVARPGEHSDGHLFVPQAVQKGAALLIAERELTGKELVGDDTEIVGVPQIIVQDATAALGRFAAANVRLALAGGELRIVGVTGSNGKTTTKNLIAAMAERLGSTVANIKSFNNEVGAPLTMLRVESDTRTLVAEMGANAEGDIAKLTAMAPPQIGVVLAVGLAHAGGFGSIEATFRGKAEMVRGLSPDGVAVLNRDDPWVTRMADLTEARVVWYGQHRDAEVRADQIEASADGTQFTLHARGESRTVRFRVLGEHHVSNALAAAAVGLELGLALDEVVASLESTTLAAPGRMQVIDCRDEITVVNDAYNANPDSMSAALKTLAQVAKPGKRTVAILGAMSELGDLTGEEHDRIGLQIVRLGIDELIVVGNAARRLHISAINEGSWDGESVFFEDSDAALAYMVDHARPGDTILLKASNAAGLHRMADQLGEVLA